jgi:hypothetical protein
MSTNSLLYDNEVVFTFFKERLPILPPDLLCRQGQYSDTFEWSRLYYVSHPLQDLA